MTEKDKMLAGELYDASAPELEAERLRARRLMHRLNTADYGDSQSYRDTVAQLLPNVGADIWIEPPFYCDYGYNIHAGNKVYFNFDCVVLDVMPVHIGSNTLFASKVQLYTATHPVDAKVRRSWLEFAKPITIGDDCWLGGGVIVCPGVTIGNGVTVGAGSVVTRDLPDNVLAAGNPCRVIRENVNTWT